MRIISAPPLLLHVHVECRALGNELAVDSNHDVLALLAALIREPFSEMIVDSDAKQPFRDSEQPSSPSATTSTSNVPTITTSSTSFAPSSALSSPLTSTLGLYSPRSDLHSGDQHLLVDMSSESADVNPTVPSVPDEPPPEFAPYQAESFEVGYEDVVSHDPHLNTDGEALYRFLLTQSESLPSTRINFLGKHEETNYRWVNYTDNQGRRGTRQERYTETITDFDFCIDVFPAHLKAFIAAQQESGPSPSSAFNPSTAANDGFAFSHWSVADDEPAYRGSMVREYETSSLRSLESSDPLLKRSTAKREEISKYKEWVKRRNALGYPPWFREDDEWAGQEGVLRELGSSTRSTLRSTKTLREWADEYCASEKYLKEFVYHKIMYGWDFSALERSLTSLITSTPYNGSLFITFTPHNSKIYIRPDNHISRMLSNKWLKFISIILLIFPFIWLFKRFHPRGGGRWEVCGGAYPLKKIVDLREEERRDVGDGKLVREQQAGGVGDQDLLIQTEDDQLPSYDELNGSTNQPHPMEAPLETVFSMIGNTIPNNYDPTTRHLSHSSHSSHPHTPAQRIQPSSSTIERMYRHDSSSSNAYTSSSNPQPRIIRTPTGLKKLYGIREGEWFRVWEPVIMRAVVGRHQSSEPLQSQELRPHASLGLDGY